MMKLRHWEVLTFRQCADNGRKGPKGYFRPKIGIFAPEIGRMGEIVGRQQLVASA